MTARQAAAPGQPPSHATPSLSRSRFGFHPGLEGYRGAAPAARASLQLPYLPTAGAAGVRSVVGTAGTGTGVRVLVSAIPGTAPAVVVVVVVGAGIVVVVVAVLAVVDEGTLDVVVRGAFDDVVGFHIEVVMVVRLDGAGVTAGAGSGDGLIAPPASNATIAPGTPAFQLIRPISSAPTTANAAPISTPPIFPPKPFPTNSEASAMSAPKAMAIQPMTTSTGCDFFTARAYRANRKTAGHRARASEKAT